MMGWHPLTWLWLALLDWLDVSNDDDDDEKCTGPSEFELKLNTLDLIFFNY